MKRYIRASKNSNVVDYLADRYGRGNVWGGPYTDGRTYFAYNVDGYDTICIDISDAPDFSFMDKDEIDAWLDDHRDWISNTDLVNLAAARGGLKEVAMTFARYMDDDR